MKKSLIAMILAATAASTLSGCDMYPPYRIYSQRIDGEAELAKQQYAKQVLVQEAEAKKQAAQAYADAEVIRAQGVAKANKIIGDSLKNNDEYLHYLWINNMGGEKEKTVVYVPTEANMPIMEAGRTKDVK
jgi:regulator of protease activity HflC (stomatin/prohibitin superfamily)